jgi:hypothetical protein
MDTETVRLIVLAINTVCCVGSRRSSSLSSSPLFLQYLV